jgi:inorganic phosphate transporter, PiT family
MDATLVIALVLAFAFAATSGMHDASDAVATLVATRGATPLQAIVLAAVFNLLGPLLVGAAVAHTIAGIATVPDDELTRVLGSALAAGVVWNLVTWRYGLPSSSSHALIGALTAASLAAGGADAVRWGGLDGWRPVGVIGTFVALALAPVIGAAAALLVIRGLRRLATRATLRWRSPLRGGQWGMSAGLALSHGANDAQKLVGVVAALLLANGRIDSLSAPTWVVVACAGFLTAGTALGGWRIMRTVGKRIYPIQPIDALASQTSSAGVIFGASLVGAPVSTTQVVASSVVGVGGGRRRWRHVDWAVVEHIALAWLLTIPAAGMLAVVVLGAWELLA